MTPMSHGEIASPRRWIAKMESAIAAARSTGATSVTIAALIGPVDMNTNNSDTLSTTQNVVVFGVTNAHHANGAAASAVTPETQRFAWRVRLAMASATHPPTNVPTNPVTTRTAPRSVLAAAESMPRMRWRNVGIQIAMPPSANV